MKSREYWDDSFEERYKKLQEDVIDKKRLPLKVSLLKRYNRREIGARARKTNAKLGNDTRTCRLATVAISLYVRARIVNVIRHRPHNTIITAGRLSTVYFG